MNVVSLISKKRDGHELTEDEIGQLIAGYARNPAHRARLEALLVRVVEQIRKNARFALDLGAFEKSLAAGEKDSHGELSGQPSRSLR